MKLIQSLLLTLTLAFGVQAHAQRTPVPVVDFVDIPVSASTTKGVSAEQVRDAIGRTAAQQRWTLTPVGDGVVEAKFVKDGKHVVVATVKYGADRYSLTYKASDDMKYEPGPNISVGASPDPVRSPSPGLLQQLKQAADKQARFFATDPATPYAVVRPNGSLHPFYEQWVRRLLAGISTELKAL